MDGMVVICVLGLIKLSLFVKIHRNYWIMLWYANVCCMVAYELPKFLWHLFHSIVYCAEDIHLWEIRKRESMTAERLSRIIFFVLHLYINLLDFCNSLGFAVLLLLWVFVHIDNLVSLKWHTDDGFFLVEHIVWIAVSLLFILEIYTYNLIVWSNEKTWNWSRIFTI